MTHWPSPLAVADYSPMNRDCINEREMVEATTGFEPVNRGFADRFRSAHHSTPHAQTRLHATLNDNALAFALAVAG